MKRAYLVYPSLLSFVARVGISTTIVLLGDRYAGQLLAAIPQTVLDIAGVLGGMLPAVGMSMLLAYVLRDMKMIIWFILGVMAVSLAGLNMIAVAVFGSCLAECIICLFQRLQRRQL